LISEKWKYFSILLKQQEKMSIEKLNYYNNKKMPLLLIDYVFDENKDIYDIIENNFIGCMKEIDKERGNNMLINYLGYKIKFRCSPIFEIDKNKFDKMVTWNKIEKENYEFM
jgi:hypothetical protein